MTRDILSACIKEWKMYSSQEHDILKSLKWYYATRKALTLKQEQLLHKLADRLPINPRAMEMARRIG